MSYGLEKILGNNTCMLKSQLACGGEERSYYKYDKWLKQLYQPLKPNSYFEYDLGNASFESIDGFVGSFTNSISNHYRSNYGTAIFNKSDNGGNDRVYPLDEVTGTAWETGICTSAHFAWLLPLLGITFATLILLVWVILKSWNSRHVLPAWKESLLPLFFHGNMFQLSDEGGNATVQKQTGPLTLANVVAGKGEEAEEKSSRLLERREMEKLARHLPVALKQNRK